jgi:hypothetical protein
VLKLPQDWNTSKGPYPGVSGGGQQTQTTPPVFVPASYPGYGGPVSMVPEWTPKPNVAGDWDVVGGTIIGGNPGLQIVGRDVDRLARQRAAAYAMRAYRRGF